MGELFYNIFIGPIVVAIFLALVIAVGFLWVYGVVSFFHWVFGGYLWVHFPIIHLIGIPAMLLYIVLFGIWWVNKD